MTNPVPCSRLAWLVCGAVLICSCERTDQAIVTEKPAQQVVDSIFPVEEDIRRFRAQVGGVPATDLRDAEESVELLAQRLISALEFRDTSAIREMLIDASEFIELYYPHTRFTKPPYRQGPGFLWSQFQLNSEKGISRALERVGGRPLGYQGVRCDPEPVLQELNRLWENCLVTWSAGPAAPSPFRLFGTIIERDRKFKFVSYSNGF